MELRKRLEVSSSWESSAPLQSILYLSNQAGNVVDEPLVSEQCTSLVLSQPAEQEGVGKGCFIHIRQLGQLSGYGVCGAELQSGSRTVEVYSGEDYITTSRGVLLGDSESGGKMYRCSLQLASDGDTYDHLTFKLLSLQGRTQVQVTRLTLTLAEDYGGKTAPSRVDSVPSKPPDLQSLLSSLPLKSNTPPFLQGLLSSLQHFSNPQPTVRDNTSDHSGQPARDETSDISQMISAFRQLRPISGEPQTNEMAVSDQDRDEEGVEREKAVSPGSLEALMDRKIAALEERLKCYIDTKMDAIMKQIEIKLEQRVSVKRVNERDRMSNMDVHTATHNGVHLEEQLD